MDFIKNQIADKFKKELDKVFEKAFAVHEYDRDWIERNKDKINSLYGKKGKTIWIKTL